jgi:hypothetical protein
LKEIILTKEQYDHLPYKDTKLTKDDSFGDIVGLLRRHGIRKYFMDEDEEAFSFILTVKFKDMEKQFPVKVTVPHLMYLKRVDPRSRAKDPPMQMTYLENESWRVAWWYLKAKLDAITYGISDDFREFMPNIYHVLPDKTEVNLSDIILSANKLNDFIQLEDNSEESKPTEEQSRKQINADYNVVEEPQ